jgi:hypothetical protein
VTKAQAGRKGGCRRSPRKRAAAKQRFRLITLSSLVSWLADAPPSVLNAPELDSALDRLTEALVQRAIIKLGLAEGVR